MANFELGKVHSNPFARAFKPQPIVEVDGEDHEVKMAEGQLDYIIKTANELKQKLGGMEKNIPGWIQDHISKSHSYLHQANSGYHELGETKKSMKLTSLLSLNEDANMNKDVKKFLDKSLGGMRAGSPPHLFAVKHTLIGALRDANFHSEAKKVPALFPKAEFEPKTYGENEEEAIDMYEYEVGPQIARICGYDGGDIVDAIGFYASMTIGRPVGEKIQKLVEMVTENKMNAYISSSDGKTFTIYNSNKQKLKNVSREELEKVMRVGNNYSDNINWKEFMGKFDKTTNLGKHWKYWKGNMVNVTIPSIGEGKSVNEGKLSISQLPFEFLFNYPNAHTTNPGNFEDWYRDGMKLKKGRIERFSPQDDKKLQSLIKIWWDEYDDVPQADFNYGRDSKEIKKVKKDILNFLKQKSNVISEAVNEATEPQTITQLRDIVKNKQYKMVKDPKTGKSLGIDMQTANIILKVYDGLSNVNKENMIKMGLPKMMDVSFKILNKYKK